MKKFLNKKFIIILSSVLVLVVGVSVYTINKKKKINKTNITYTRTIVLSSSSLQETVVASGTIESQTTSTISSNINGATVSKINFSVGDYVEEGDIIIELDTTNLNKQITKQEEKLNDQQDELQTKKDDAWGEYYDAQNNYNTAKSAYEITSSIISAKENEYNTKVNAVSTTYNALMAAYPDAIVEKSGSTISIKNSIGADISVEAVADTYISSVNEMNAAKIELETVKETNNYDSIEKAYQEAKSKYEQAKSAFNTAQSNLDEGVDTGSLDELYDTVSDYKLKAKTSGQITNISAVLGSNISGTLATIQDTSKLKISLNIDEYDILKLSLGMKAIVETDASTETYEGEVSQISPVASSSMGSSGGFEIEVNITSEDITGLLIGMNAEVTIVISETNNNFNVPKDAVETKENGSQVIYVQNEKGEFEELEVTTGETNGYYIEIFSDELKQGMIIRASANQDESEINSYDDEEKQEEGFEFGGFGIGQGNMPQGGNIPPGERMNRQGRGPGGFNG